MTGALGQAGPLAVRSIVRTFRQPQIVLPECSFHSSSTHSSAGPGKTATKIPGFPTSSYATFGLAMPFAFTGIYATIVAGGQLGDDLQTGFVRRLSLTATGSVTILAGQLAGVIVFAVFQAAIFLGVGFAVGAHARPASAARSPSSRLRSSTPPCSARSG